MSKEIQEPIREIKPLLAQLICKCGHFQVDSYNKTTLNPQDYECPKKLGVCELVDNMPKEETP